MAALFAASYPERTVGLILYDGFAVGPMAANAPPEPTEPMLRILQAQMESTINRWGEGDSVDWIAPSIAGVPGAKHQWGAFYGTELDLQLRRRGVRTIVLCGIATNFGVESTARDAWERNYALVFAEDAMAGLNAEAHQFAITTIFPRLGRVRSTDEILRSLQR